MLCLVGGISLVLWILNFRRVRAVADTPTSRVASAPQGYVELCGIARQHPGQPLIGAAHLDALRLVPLRDRGEARQELERGASAG